MAPPLVLRERADQLRDGRGGRQHRLVFQQLGFGLADAVQDVLSDVHVRYIGNRRISVFFRMWPNVIRRTSVARIHPELVVFVVQDVSFRLVVDDHRAIVRGPDDDVSRPGRPS